MPGTKMLKALKNKLRPIYHFLINKAAGKYIAGETLLLAQGAINRNANNTIGYWDGDDDSIETIVDQYLESIEAIKHNENGSYISIKVPSIKYNYELMDKIIHKAVECGVAIHFDSLDIDTADKNLEVALYCKQAGVKSVSISLPARWARSEKDAMWASRNGIVCRVITGQWEDPSYVDIDTNKNFLSLISLLSKQDILVRVATHDFKLLKDSIEILKSNSKYEIELLYGLPSYQIIKFADLRHEPIRTYIPYGHSWVPYCLENLKGNPLVILNILRDSFLSAIKA